MNVLVLCDKVHQHPAIYGGLVHQPSFSSDVKDWFLLETTGHRGLFVMYALAWVINLRTISLLKSWSTWLVIFQLIIIIDLSKKKKNDVISILSYIPKVTKKILTKFMKKMLHPNYKTCCMRPCFQHCY